MAALSAAPITKFEVTDVAADELLGDVVGGNHELPAAGEKLLRVTATPGDGSPPRTYTFDAAGHRTTASPSMFPAARKRNVWVLESSRETIDTHGLYYTDSGGRSYLITPDHWHDNYDITNDGQFVVTTTWDGEVLVWSTEQKQAVYRKKLNPQYGYLAYDAMLDRFLLADATENGTSYLRALVRANDK